MSKKQLRIWGREFLLDVSWQNYPGEEVTVSQKECLESVSGVDYSISEKDVKAYIRKYFSDELNGEEIDNIFRFVMPKSILIPRSKQNLFAVLCNFKLDMEHGIAVIFENGQFKEAGPQDLIL